MKNLPLILSIASLIGVIALLGMQLSGSKPAEQAQAAPAQTPTEGATNIDLANKVVFVNTDSLIANYELVKELDAEFVKAKNRRESKLTAQQQQYQQNVAETERIVSEKPELYQRAVQEVAQMEQALMIEQQKMEQELLLINQRNIERVNEAVNTFIDSFAVEKGYHYVLRKNTITGVLYGDDLLDITSTVGQLLNAEYQAKQAAEEAKK